MYIKRSCHWAESRTDQGHCGWYILPHVTNHFRAILLKPHKVSCTYIRFNHCVFVHFVVALTTRYKWLMKTKHTVVVTTQWNSRYWQLEYGFLKRQYVQRGRWCYRLLCKIWCRPLYCTPFRAKGEFDRLVDTRHCSCDLTALWPFKYEAQTALFKDPVPTAQ